MTVQARPLGVVPVALASLAETAGAAPPAANVAVTGITLRSDAVQPGDLYAALPGARTHGARYAADARARGAVALLTDPEGMSLAGAADLPALVVPDPRRLLGRIAAVVYGSPAEALTVIGVTGTQGKTTTTHLLSGALAAAGHRVAVVGTIGAWIAGEPVASSLTTPEAPDLHALFAVMRERGVAVCAMEVSSHALAMGRVDGVVFDVAVFLNFGRDHLDFHRDEDDYFAAKASLFTPQRAVRALLNADDSRVALLAQELRIPVHTWSASGAAADWRAYDVTLGEDGSSLGVAGPGGVDVTLAVRLPGAFNVANAVAAVAAAGEAGLDVGAVAHGIADVASVRGRLERVGSGHPFTVVVDYAHKPDAITAVLGTLREVTSGRLIVVLGAGGDRDHGKRPLMGAAAARLADLVVVTDDNPRSEDPAAIRSAVLSGVRTGAAGRSVEVHEVADRRRAIELVLRGARPGDTVLIAGKGHERGQEVAGRILPFDDRAVAAELLGSLTGTVGGA